MIKMIPSFEKVNNFKFPKTSIPFETKPKCVDIFNKSDFAVDFTEKFDIENDSVCLALNTLGMSRTEYNSSSIDELKSKRRIDCNNVEIWSINILIYYKKSSRLFLPELNPNKNILTNNSYDNLSSNSNHKIKNF